MKLTALIFIITCMHVSAHSYSQTVSFSGKNVPLQAVFASIEKQTGLSFFFNLALMKDTKPVTLDLKEVTLEDALRETLKDEGLDYYRMGKTIFIVKKQNAVVSSDTPVPGESKAKLTDVKGRVVNQQGEALVGATVTMKNGKKATLTDEKGGFELKGVPVGATLEITFLGYQKHEVEVGSGDIVRVEMVEANNKLDEVQVIAYGNTTARLSTGNVSTVKGDEISKQPVSNPLLALEGRVPGLFITEANGVPGGKVTIRVQGQNSISYGNDPLFIIDGVPYNPQLSTSSLASGTLTPLGGLSGNGGNPFNYINPSDIESVEVLKDADATAIYGSRAANGAILITTKKGKAGKIKADINLQQGAGKVTRKMSLLNTPQYLQMRREALKNDLITTPSANDYDVNGLWDTTRYTDWQKTLIGGTMQYTTVNGNISGGSANTQYLIGSSYHRETTVFPGNFSDRKGSLHFSLNNTSSDQKFVIQFTGNYLLDNNQLPSTDLTSTAVALAPDAPTLYKTDGTLNWAPNTLGASSWINPLSNLFAIYKNKTSNLISNAILSYKILPGLDIKSSFGYNNLQIDEFDAYQPSASIAPENQATTSRVAYYANNNTNSWIIEPQINYRKVFGRHKLDALIGSTIQQTNNQGTQTYGIGYNSDAVLQNILAASTVGVASTINSVYKYNALFGRFNYNLMNRYLADITIRRDGSSRFGFKNQFHNFGSVAAAWIFSDENFIKDWFTFLSFGKVKGSFGTTGSDQIGDYQFLNLYNPTATGVAYQNSPGLSVNGIPNPYLQWEETQKLQFSVDLGFFRDRILISANYIQNKSSNQLLQYALPVFTGNSGVLENFPATVQNKAWEFQVNTNNIKSKNFSWNSSFNLTIPQNELISFPNLATSTYATKLVIGQPVSIIRAFHFLGVNPLTGLYQLIDGHGNPTSTPSSVTDKSVLINTLPTAYGGFQNSFSYKGFQLDVFFQFVKQIGSNFFFGTTPGVRGRNQPISVRKRWQIPGDEAIIQRYNSNNSILAQFNYATASDAAYSDASFIRLKNLSISYLFSGRWLRIANISTCRIYLQGQNLLTITKYTGMDPENQSIIALPPLRILTAGLQVGL